LGGTSVGVAGGGALVGVGGATVGTFVGTGVGAGVALGAQAAKSSPTTVTRVTIMEIRRVFTFLLLACVRQIPGVSLTPWSFAIWGASSLEAPVSNTSMISQINTTSFLTGELSREVLLKAPSLRRAQCRPRGGFCSSTSPGTPPGTGAESVFKDFPRNLLATSWRESHEVYDDSAANRAAPNAPISCG